MPESNNIFYPSVKDLVSLDNLPASLSFVEEGLDTILEHIYFKDFVVHKTFYREFGEYKLTAIIFEDVGISFPGTDGLKLLLNPGTLQNTLEIPIALNYYWTIIRYKNQFSFNSFDNAINSIIEILFEIAGTTKEAFLLDAIDTFIPQEDSISEFVNTFNSEFTETLGITDSEDLVLSTSEVLDFLGQNNYDVINVVVTMFLNNDSYSFDELFERVQKLFNRYFGKLEKEDFYQILIPQFNFEIQNIDLALQFPRKWLRPIYTGPTDYPDVDASSIQIGDVLPEPYHSRLVYNVGRFRISSKKGFEFFNEDSFDFKRSEIGKTGLQVEFSNLKLDLRKDRNIPEATADGRPDDFRGVYAGLAAITLPKKWFNNVDNSTLRIAGYNMLIGTGGVSGTVALETINGTPNTNDDYMPVNIGNWELGFKNFDITFKQNAVIESNIAGRLKIPKLKDADGNEALIQINGHLNEEGDFNLTASEPEGIPLNLFNFVTINFLSLELGRQEGDFYVGTSCEIWFENAIMQRVLGDQKIVIPKLRVYEDGSMEIVGGNAFIPTNISLNLGPIEIAVTGIHFGSHQQEHNGVMRKYNYWGFDGAISLDPLGIDARGEGIKYYYTTDNDEHGGSGDTFLRIQTIEVDLIIPGTADPDSALAIINGMLSIPEPGESPEYEGKIGLKLPKARISGAAHMRLQPKEPAFIIEAGIEMPTPIPLAATGLAFYGFGGLLGYKYVAEKEAIGLVSGENTWYEYYTYPQRGVNLRKFSGPPRTNQYDLPVAVGAGTVLGTMHDDGFLFSTRLMAILSLPSVFILDGRANVLGERLGILDNTEPPFFAGVAVGDNSFEFWFGADYQLPKSNGWIIDLYAEVQAGFFFNNPSAWYLNFGTKDAPISARVLTILTAQSYLMLSATGIEAGARVDFQLKKNFFGIKVEISAYVEVGGFISFERFQLGGYIAFGGTIAISVWKLVGFRVSLDAILSAEAAKPFLLFAQLRIRVCIRIIFKICKTFKVKLKWEKNKQVDRTPIPALPNGTSPNYPDRTKESVQGVHMLTNETYELNYFASVPNANSIDKIIPLDTYIDIKAMKGLIPGAISDKIGGHTGGANNFIDLIPPQKVVRGGHELRQVKHKYSIEKIAIKMWNGSSWQDYHPFEAVVPVDERPNVDHLRIGYWQRNGQQYDAIRLLATNAFSYMEAGEPGWFIPEEYGITPSELYCVSTKEKGDCSDFLNKPLGTKYFRPNGYIGHYINGAYYSIEEGNDDLEQTVYVMRQRWEKSLFDTANNQDYTRVNFDRIEIRKNGASSTSAIGVNVDIYTLEDGVATNLTEIAEQYKQGINTLLVANGSKEITSFEFTEVTVENGNIIVDVEIKSDYPFPDPNADDMFLTTLFLKRIRANGASSVRASRGLTTEIIRTTSNAPSTVGCMEITNTTNNHDYAKSLQFSNKDMLIIILPEASVKTELKLTTNAEGVTIRYYKTLLTDNTSTPQYELIHEVYKTKAELTTEVLYENENKLTTKITVTPKNANSHLINQIREEIAELFETSYDGENGEVSILTPADEARYRELLAQLEQLTSQGCSAVETTPKPKVIAQIYNEIDNDGIDEYRFRVYNNKCEIILSSSTRYYSKEAAVSELKTSVFNIVNNPNSIVIKRSKNNKFYFNVVDPTGEVIARRIEYFDTEKECQDEIKHLQDVLKESEIMIGEETCKQILKKGASSERFVVAAAAPALSLENTVFNSYKYLHTGTNSQRFNRYQRMRVLGGNIYAIGYPSVNVAGSNYNDGVLTKLDIFGKVIYSKVYYLDGSLPMRFQEIEEMSDGNLLVLGRGYANRLYYMKINAATGAIIWQKYFNCNQEIQDNRFALVKTNRRTFYIACLTSLRDRLYVLEINELGTVVRQNTINNSREYWFEIGAASLDLSGGLVLGIRRRSRAKPHSHSSMFVRFDETLKLSWSQLIQSKTEIEITNILIANNNFYFITDDITSSKSILSYIPYSGYQSGSFRTITNHVLPSYANWKLTGSNKTGSVTVCSNSTPIYNVKIESDNRLVIDTRYTFNTPTAVSGIEDIYYDAQLGKYTMVSSEYLALLGADLKSCVTKKEEVFIELPKVSYAFTPTPLLIQNSGIESITFDGIKIADQSLTLEKELCPTNSGGCERNPIICEEYDKLLEIYNSCFVPITTSEQVDASLKCFQDFRGIVKGLLNIQGIVLSPQLSTLYEEYVQLFLQIERLVGHHEQILRFGRLKQIAIEMLELIKMDGDCDCDNDGGGNDDDTEQICNTSLQEVCWLSIEKHEYNLTIPGQDAIEQEQEDMEEAVQRTAQPIWRPNTKYYVYFQLKDEVDNGAGGDVFDYYYGFKTVGPVGHYHKHPSVDYVPANANPDAFPLTSLRQYIDYNRSYPNADGNLLQAKPVFYGQEQCRITLYFSKPLTYHMLNNWESYNGAPALNGSMHIAIKDPVTDAIIPYPLPIDYNEETVPLPEGNGEGGVPWVDDNDPRIPLNIRILNNFINYINENNDAIECNFTIGNAIKPQSYAYSVTLTNLKPQKLYSALIYNAFEVASDDALVSEQVHNYVFQTSRYKNFGKQVNSYMLEDDEGNTRQSVFDIPLTLTSTEINTAYNIIAGNNDANSDILETQYQNLFDRALEGVLGMQPLDPAINTEFNKITDENGVVRAILIRNPEPFNIPKIPIETIQNEEVIAVLNSGVVDANYKVLYSKDYSQALIMHSGKEITNEVLDFRFKYLIWDGSAYVVEDTIVVNDISIA